VDYAVKTASKVLFFTLIPWYYYRFISHTNPTVTAGQGRKGSSMKAGLLFGVVSFAVILVTYYFTSDLLDLQGIVQELRDKSGITRANFLLVGLYITFGNSFLEEFFFRGFVFLALYKQGKKLAAYLFSAALFGLYHIAIFQTWFNPWLIVLALFGLGSVGLIFNWLNTRPGGFLNSWLTHALADSAIILIGLRLFGMI